MTNDASTLYIAAAVYGLFALNMRSGKLTAIDSVPAPTGVALTRDNRTLFVSYQSGGPDGRPGHDAICQFDTASGRRVRCITGLANVGHGLAISPDGTRLWANGLDACFSRRYDHVGCPMAPGSVIHAIDIGSGKPVRAIGLAGTGHSGQPGFHPSGTLVAANGNGLRLIDSETFEPVAADPLLVTWATVFEANGRRAYATAVLKNAVAVLSIAERRSAIATLR